MKELLIMTAKLMPENLIIEELKEGIKQLENLPASSSLAERTEAEDKLGTWCTIFATRCSTRDMSARETMVKMDQLEKIKGLIPDEEKTKN